MQKKTILWTALAITAAGVAVYYLRKRRADADRYGKKRDRHNSQVFARAKGYASGEYTL
jgi:hypothetical protein